MTRELTDDWGMLRAIGYAQELTDLTQNSDRAILPAAWNSSVQVPFRGIAIFALATPGNQHSFTFFLQSAGTTIGAVTMTTSGNFWQTSANFSLRGLTDYVSVRHDTNAQDGDEMAGAHSADGSRIWAILLPA